MTIGTNASPGSSAGANASNGLLYVPYNRYTQLSAYVDAGTGYAGNTYTVDVAGKATNWGPGPSQLVAYPAPGETGVPRGTSSAENPNPLPDTPARQIGIPISLLGAFGESLTISTITLADPSGAAIPGRLVVTNTDTGASLGNNGFFVPMPPWTSPPTATTTGMLEKNTTYKVAATGPYRGTGFSFTWSFTTSNQ